MGKNAFRAAEENRKNRNAEILHRMANGESLVHFDSAASWFPPRPIVKKDRQAVTQLYGTNVKVLNPTGRLAPLAAAPEHGEAG